MGRLWLLLLFVDISGFCGGRRVERDWLRSATFGSGVAPVPFFATLKTEFYYRRVWPTRSKAKMAVGGWIEDRYNRRRRHASIGQISPVDFELQYSNQTAAEQKAA